MTSNTNRFSDRVENYIKYRPDYPGELSQLLSDEIGLSKEKVIADIGSGTGKLSQPFLKNGNTVYGVEPNKEMRNAAEKLFQSFPNFISIDGTAEKTMLPSHTVDMVVVGQAFHWFDPIKAKQEFERILKYDGWVVLIWNERDNSSPFLKSYDNFLYRYSTDYAEIDHRNINENDLMHFFGKTGFSLKVLPHQQVFDFHGLIGRYLSCSYALDERHPQFSEAMSSLKSIFYTYQSGNQLVMEYKTKIYIGRLD